MAGSESTSRNAAGCGDSALYILRITLATMFLTLCLSGLLLMAAYNPATTTAWGSVWYIQTQMTLGWLIRGIHYFASEALLVVALLYIVVLVVKHAYRGAGGRVWVVSLLIVGLSLAASLTGHLLPWDQEGYWGTVVRTNILARTPIIGDALRQVLWGGTTPGNFTLARFYALHVVLLPLLLSPVLRCLPLFRRILPEEAGSQSTPRASGWPVGRLALTVVVLVVVGFHYATGAPLFDAPADPGAVDYPVRPEWHTLFLFQWLKLFEGPTAELFGSIIIPAVVGVALFSLPLAEMITSPSIGRKVVIAVSGGLGLVIVGLTVAQLVTDRAPNPATLRAVKARQIAGKPMSAADEAVLRAAEFQVQRRRARTAAERAIALARRQGIPPAGPLALLENDPLTRGPRLFAAHCASCHRFYGHDGLDGVPVEPAASSDLGGFGSRDWIRGLLKNPESPTYFGLMKKPDGGPAHTKMARWVKSFRAENATDLEAAEDRLDAVAAYLASESLHPGRYADIDAYTDLMDDARTGEAQILREGRLFFMRTCNECHTYNGDYSGTTRAPEMMGYGSVDWLALMIAEPDHQTRFRSTGQEPAQMPRFAERLTSREIRLIARWIHDSRDTAP